MQNVGNNATQKTIFGSNVGRISMRTGTVLIQIWRNLQNCGLYAYHLQRVKNFLPEDMPVAYIL